MSKQPMRATGTLNILLVEDSAVLAGHVSELIGRLPDVQLKGIAETERDAIRMVGEIHPQVLILDLHLREGNGFGVLRGIERIRPRPQVVVLTTFGLEEYRVQARKLGVAAFLDKSDDYHLLPGLLLDMARDSSDGACG